MTRNPQQHNDLQSAGTPPAQQPMILTIELDGFRDWLDDTPDPRAISTALRHLATELAYDAIYKKANDSWIIIDGMSKATATLRP